MYTILVVVQVLVAIALIALVLLQQGKGADAGAAFGSGASGTVFGARGSANFLSSATAWLAAAFFAVSLALAYFVNARSESESIVDKLAPAAAVTAPAAAVPTPAIPAESAPAAAPGAVVPAEAAQPKVPE
ncbi:MAG: preprotein translocase subunit SecG [Pseudomonadota bacterium]